MLKKMLSCVAVLLLASVVSAAPVKVLEKFAVAPESAAVKAGEVVKFKLAFECVPGAKVGSFKAFVHRKEAPAEFFARNSDLIRWSDRKTKKVSGYDAIWLTDDKNFPVQLAAGECEIVINTSGMAAGDYSIPIQGWVLKDKKSYYSATRFYLTITGEDGKKFVATPQILPAAARQVKAVKNPAWIKSCVFTPAELAGVAGSKYPVNCDLTVSDKYFFGGYCVKVLRKDAPEAFFKRENLDMRYRFKDKKVDGYDYAILVKFKHMPSVASQKFDFELDTAGFPVGNYKLAVEVRLVDRATGKTSYPSVFLPMIVQ